MADRKETAVGLQLSREFALVTWYRSELEGPVTCGNGEDEEPESVPVPEEVSGILFDEDKDAGAEAAKDLRPLADFLEKLLEMVPVPEGEERDPASMRVMVTLPFLRSGVENDLSSALMELGIERKKIYLQDYLSSFFHYTINQKRELWSGDVALLEYEDSAMVGYVLHIDHSKTPALATAEEAARMQVDEDIMSDRSPEDRDREKDRMLFEFLKKVFERRNVSTSYLVGEYFGGTWAVRSFQYLCQHRHAFRGGNLYTKGACFAAMSRAGMIRTPDILFLGAHMLRENLGMYMRVNGKEVYYPVISAGVNWYEAHHECEFIPDGEDRITLVSKPMTGGEEIYRVMRLAHFPNRPNRATRLRMTVYFTSAKCCVIEVEDLGFGGFFQPEGIIWKREIWLEETGTEAGSEL